MFTYCAVHINSQNYRRNDAIIMSYRLHEFAIVDTFFCLKGMYEEICSCAAKTIFYCPSMNSHRPRFQNTAKERALIPEKDSKRKRPRSHVSLEKSSQNYKPLEK